MNSVESDNDVYRILDELAESGKSRFDPLNFKYAKALLDKARAATPSVARKLETKAAKVLSTYQENLSSREPQAKQHQAYLAKHGVNVAEEGGAALSQFNYHELSLKAQRLESRLERQKAVSSLSRLFSAVEEDPFEQQQLSFDDLLLDHERTTIRNLVGESDEQQAHQSDNPFGDLKSHKLFKDSWVKIHAENLVSEAIEEAPKDAGPLNSHMLAIKSIEAMKNLSPEYLNRFVSFMDSLLWLEKMVEQEVSAGKQARKTKKR
ncbi:MAG: DUF2894 domain-containing protein [Pseudomonadales bacterium]|nr:DUF2894 domain-containing protein [Pseudomonadales bacterium]